VGLQVFVWQRVSAVERDAGTKGGKDGDGESRTDETVGGGGYGD